MILLSLEERQTVDEAVKALATHDHGLYQRGGLLVRIVWPTKAAQARGVLLSGGPVIQSVPLADLRLRLTAAAVYVVPGLQGRLMRTRPSRWLIDGVPLVGAVGRHSGISWEW